MSLAADFDRVGRDQWMELVEQVLRGAPFDKKLVGTTYDGIQIQPTPVTTTPETSASPVPRRSPGAAGLRAGRGRSARPTAVPPATRLCWTTWAGELMP